MSPVFLWVESETLYHIWDSLKSVISALSQYIQLPHSFESKNKFVKYYLFGVGYAVGGIGCTLPAFLFVIFAALGSGSFSNGLINFLAFSLGTVLLMLVVTTATAISKSFMEKLITSKMAIIQKLTSLIIIGAGGYLVYFNLRAFVF